MKTHCAVIEAGPASVRRLCCRTTNVPGDTVEIAQAALDAIDDAVALVKDRPVLTRSLWSTVLRSLTDERHSSMLVYHPSWWSASRVEVVRCAATSVTDEIVTRRRTELLIQAASSPPPAVIVEIAEQFVVVTAAEVAAERRDGEPQSVAERVARIVADMTAGTTGTVLIDAPPAIDGAAALAAMVADQSRVANADLTVIEVDDSTMSNLVEKAFSVEEDLEVRDATSPTPGLRRPSRYRTFILPFAAAVLATAVLCTGLLDRRAVPVADEVVTTSLVEGRIALTVPAHWSAQRVVDGPGSARIQVNSPADPEIALHVTQSAVADQALSDTADVLKRAIDAAPSGVFVDFNPSSRSAGRPVVTYREVRTGHDIRWSVLLDGAVRISIGCQSRPGAEAAVREVCEQAVRSARALR